MNKYLMSETVDVPKKAKRADMFNLTITAILGCIIGTAQFLIAVATGFWCGKP
jgi:hypothetical protein